jgi:magnesium chelatase family protein
MGNKEIKEFCRLDSGSINLLHSAMTRLNFSARSYQRILKVARTIADLGGVDLINENHVSEALQLKLGEI